MDVESMVAYVEHYINVRTGKVVRVSLRSQKDALLLMKAYNYAMQWFGNNKVDVTIYG